MAAVPSIGRAAGVEPRQAPEADATRALYERYARQIYSYCLHQLSSREEAEDAVQTTFMNAFRGLKRGVVPEAEQAWLFKIAENVCLSRRRSSWRRGRVESPNDFEVLQEIVPSRSTTSNVDLIGLEDALAAMPENQRRAILLREWQGLSYREIADELELSQAAVETLIFRARRTLAAGLEQPIEQTKRRLRGRAGEGFNLGTLLAGLKSALTGGAAVKAVALAAAATVAAQKTEHAIVIAHRHHQRHHHVAAAKAQAAGARTVTPQAQAAFSPQATIVAAATGTTPLRARRLVHPLADVATFAGVTGHGSAAGVESDEPSPAADPAEPTAGVPTVVPPAEQPTAGAPAAAPPAAPAVPPAAPASTAAPTPATSDAGRKTESHATPKSGPRAAVPGSRDSTSGDKKHWGKTTDPAPAGTATPGAAVDNGRSNGNKGKDKKSESTPAAPEAAAPPTPIVTDNGRSNGKGDGNGRKSDPSPTPAAVAPPTPATPATTDGGRSNGKGDGNNKKSDLVPATPTVTTPATPPVTTPTGNGKGDDADKGGKKDAPPVAPAPVVPAATPPAATPTTPTTVSNNPPMHGDGTGGKGSRDKGK